MAAITAPEIEALTDEEFTMRLQQLVSDSMGLAGYVRFLRMYGVKRGDYTEDRQHWLSDDVFREMVASHRKD